MVKRGGLEGFHFRLLTWHYSKWRCAAPKKKGTKYFFNRKQSSILGLGFLYYHFSRLSKGTNWDVHCTQQAGSTVPNAPLPLPGRGTPSAAQAASAAASSATLGEVDQQLWWQAHGKAGSGIVQPLRGGGVKKKMTERTLSQVSERLTN